MSIDVKKLFEDLFPDLQSYVIQSLPFSVRRSLHPRFRENIEVKKRADIDRALQRLITTHDFVCQWLNSLSQIVGERAANLREVHRLNRIVQSEIQEFYSQREHTRFIPISSLLCAEYLVYFHTLKIALIALKMRMSQSHLEALPISRKQKQWLLTITNTSSLRNVISDRVLGLPSDPKIAFRRRAVKFFTLSEARRFSYNLCKIFLQTAPAQDLRHIEVFFPLLPKKNDRDRIIAEHVSTLVCLRRFDEAKKRIEQIGNCDIRAWAFTHLVRYRVAFLRKFANIEELLWMPPKSREKILISLFKESLSFGFKERSLYYLNAMPPSLVRTFHAHLLKEVKRCEARECELLLALFIADVD